MSKAWRLLVASTSALAMAGASNGLIMAGASPAHAAPVAGSRGDQRPNVVVILADDLGYGDTSAYGSKIVRTPNIERLAASGVKFTSGYVTHPVCAPSRAGLLTGRYQERFGYEFNPVGRDRESGVSLHEIMLPQIMKGAGYATGMVGKWHLGQPGPYYPTQRGLDYFWGMAGGGTVYITDPKPGDAFVSRGSEKELDDAPDAAPAPAPQELSRLKTLLERARARQPITRNGVLVQEEGYLTEAVTRESLAFIDQHQGRPFFLEVAYHAPHTPLQTTKKYYDRFPEIADKGTRIHAAMISAMDDGVGMILDRLKADGLDRDTLVFFLSDNGCPATIGAACSNAPLVGYKRTHFEGGVRVPFIISWPGHIAAGRIDGRPVSSLDIVPTAVAVAHGRLPSDRQYDGVNLIPFLTARRSQVPNPVLFWRAGPTFAIRDGQWKMLMLNKAPPGAKRGGGHAVRPNSAEPATLPPYPATYGRHVMLYDLAASPIETRNLADRDPAQVERLKAELAGWDKLLVAPQWPSRRQSYETYDGVLLHLYD